MRSPLVIPVALIACGGESISGSDAGDAASGDDHADAAVADAGDAVADVTDASSQFLCGTGKTVCDPKTQYCYIVMSGSEGTSPGQCQEPADGGAPTCQGANLIAMMPGECGCYESSNGDVTLTVCPP